MKNLLILFTICILFFSCKREDTNFLVEDKKIDSLLSIAYNTNDNKLKLVTANKILSKIENDKIDSIFKKRCSGLAGIYFSLNEKKKCLKLSEILITNPSIPVNDYQVAFSNYYIAFYNMYDGDYKTAYIHFSRAEKSFDNLKNYEFLANTLNYKADILSFKKDFSGAEVLSIKALKIAKDNQYYNLVYSCYLTLGNSLLGLQDYDKSIEYYEKSILTCENLKLNPNFNAFKLLPLNYIATVYQKKKDYKNAIKFARQGLDFDSIKSKELQIYCYLTNNLTYSKFKLGDKTVVNKFKETLKIGDSLKFAPIQITSKTYLGEYYLSQKDTIKANLYLKDAQNQAHKNNIFEDELKILQLLANANPNDKSFYSNRYISLNDSLQNVERATRDKFARIEFETDEITAEKNSLNIEKNQVAMQRWFIAGISILSVLLMFLWYRNKLQKAKTRELLLKQEQQKANEEIYQLMLDQQQKIQEGKQLEKQRISQELHDGVMGRLSGIRMNLFVLNKKTDSETIAKCLEYIKEIQSIEKEIRTIAHDLNNNMFSDTIHFQSIVQNLFTSIQNHSDIEFDLKVDEKINWEIVPNATKISVYRIIQEALQNIDKYAQAKLVIIQMDHLKDAIAIEINDNGIGFSINTKKNGIGITNMQTRMQEMKGNFTITSQPKKGTKINLTIPI